MGNSVESQAPRDKEESLGSLGEIESLPGDLTVLPALAVQGLILAKKVTLPVILSLFRLKCRLFGGGRQVEFSESGPQAEEAQRRFNSGATAELPLLGFVLALPSSAKQSPLVGALRARGAVALTSERPAAAVSHGLANSGAAPERLGLTRLSSVRRGLTTLRPTPARIGWGSGLYPLSQTSEDQCASGSLAFFARSATDLRRVVQTAAIGSGGPPLVWRAPPPRRRVGLLATGGGRPALERATSALVASGFEVESLAEASRLVAEAQTLGVVFALASARRLTRLIFAYLPTAVLRLLAAGGPLTPEAVTSGVCSFLSGDAVEWAQRLSSVRGEFVSLLSRRGVKVCLASRAALAYETLGLPIASLPITATRQPSRSRLRRLLHSILRRAVSILLGELGLLLGSRWLSSACPVGAVEAVGLPWCEEETVKVAETLEAKAAFLNQFRFGLPAAGGSHAAFAFETVF